MRLLKKIQYKKYLNFKLYHNLHVKKNEVKFTVDFRSDTFTKPSEGMRNAMRDATVGDDVWQEDITVLELENKMAEITQKDSGLYVTSGTMGNLLSILSHCSRRGAEVLLGSDSHIFQYEQANIVQFGGVQPYTVPTKADGTFNIEHLESCIRECDFHCPSTELICLENTHANVGGKFLPLQFLDEIAVFAKGKGLPIHVDGARLFNASVASGLPVSRLLTGVNSASICLSKGLGAPVGTVIVGDHEFIDKARRLRKGLGGGWRQAGILAAAGLYALNYNIQRLEEDHMNAKLIAKGIFDMKSNNISVNVDDVSTNIVVLQVNSQIISPEDFCQKLMQVNDEEREAIGKTVSVLASPMPKSSVRMVTHLDITKNDAISALSKIQFVIRSLEPH